MRNEARLFDKKPYRKPRIIVYGDFRLMTQNVNMKAGQFDGGFNSMGGARKTH